MLEIFSLLVAGVLTLTWGLVALLTLCWLAWSVARHRPFSWPHYAKILAAVGRLQLVFLLVSALIIALLPNDFLLTALFALIVLTVVANVASFVVFTLGAIPYWCTWIAWKKRIAKPFSL